jgi:branched-chain amino acid transport system substrate-binding protein
MKEKVMRFQRSTTLVAVIAGTAMLSACSSTGATDAANLTGEPITIGAPFAQSGPAGIADHQDCWNGTDLAIEQINAAGGIGGRPLALDVTDIDLLSPEGTTAAFEKLVSDNVDAIVSAFTLIPPPALDVAAAYGAPYISGDTSKDAIALALADRTKYNNYFSDPAEAFYGSGFVTLLTSLDDRGEWTPTNNKIDILRGDTAYNQNIADATIEAIEASNGQWALGQVIDITAGTKDWAPIISKLQASPAGAIMVDHWVGAELASFSQQFAANPVENSLVYLQYGPSQPEYLEIAGTSAEGFVWGSVIATGNTTDAAKTFRADYQEKYGVNDTSMGLVYTGWCYDAVQVLAQAWRSVDPSDFAAVNKYISANPYDGVSGHLDFSNVSTPVYPTQIDDAAAGVTAQFFQVQDGRHTTIAPEGYNEASFVNPPWMK